MRPSCDVLMGDRLRVRERRLDRVSRPESSDGESSRLSFCCELGLVLDRVTGASELGVEGAMARETGGSAGVGAVPETLRRRERGSTKDNGQTGRVRLVFEKLDTCAESWSEVAGVACPLVTSGEVGSSVAEFVESTEEKSDPLLHFSEAQMWEGEYFLEVFIGCSIARWRDARQRRCCDLCSRDDGGEGWFFKGGTETRLFADVVSARKRR